MSSISTVNIGWLNPFLEILDEAGIDSAELLQVADLPILSFDDGSAMVPTAKVYDFVALANKASGTNDLGFQAGSCLDMSLLVPKTGGLGRRPGVLTALEHFIHVALKSSSKVDMWIETEPDKEGMVGFHYQGSFDSENLAFSTVEQYMVALMVRLLRYSKGRAWCPTLVNFRAASVPIRSARKLLGHAEIRCGEKTTSLIFPADCLHEALEQDPPAESIALRRHDRARSSRNEGELVYILRRTLGAYLPDGSMNIKLAARLCGVSVRTLQRRLSERGTSYSEQLEGVRCATAVRLLEDSKKRVTDIGRELGYRDPAIFTRAFRRWTGVAPSEYRRRRKR